MAPTAAQRICFQQWIQPERIEEYRRRHAAVWPEMLEALETAGWHNYSLFLRPDGLLIGYVETDSIDAATARMGAYEVNARWQAEMAGLFDGVDAPPDAAFVPLEEVFNLESQLAAARAAAEPRHAPSSGTEPHTAGERP
ncbi:L-rhamnose mutarotase [Sinomonas sp. ASV486]|uniref:L-rhamnose mutarotase n=1 Tax=Sinomonas sp. ASV486 TaxID=3051170 RepID=UPI0027DDC5BD|nr:L-rhamnose mutarotase [Sinomonas sp. ASV486]MDQ4492063.1 L-rhamnose mutarotase [Sinomonas sp. ASV486]